MEEIDTQERAEIDSPGIPKEQMRHEHVHGIIYE